MTELDQADDADPARVATQQDFGRELSLAKQRAGVTVREVARAAGLPASTAGDYFSGRHLPPAAQPELLAQILRACGETDPGRLREWTSALARARRSPGRRGAGARPPYRGLASFQPEDAPWFFGRADVTGWLAGLAAATGVPLVVVGSSGSGKSSLLRAGLIPHLLARPSTGTRPVALFTPAADLVADLAAQLSMLTAAVPDQARSADDIEAALRADPASAAMFAPEPAGSAIVVVDQFEAVFTGCDDASERLAFISAVCALASAAVVVLALRADFYAHALRYRQLATALQDRQVVLGPMSREQVRTAIVEPARLARIDVEDGLVEVLLRDLAPRSADGELRDAAHEPGALPLLSHALLATWHHSHGGKLTVADYQATGGLGRAIAKTADDVYDQLAADQQATARRLFLRLVHVGDDTPETRSTQQVSELYDRPLNGTLAGDVLSRFVAARLITVDAGTAQISHEALLTEWPRLRAWIDADREDLLIRRRIGNAAQAWAASGRDSAALLRGSLLAVASDFAADQDNLQSLSQLARDFVGLSAAQEKIRQQAERNRTQRLRRQVAALTALVLVTCGLAAFAFQQREAATAARDTATAARDDADSREAAIEASQTAADDVSLASQLAVAAYRIAPTTEARSSLLESSGEPQAARLLDSSGPVQSISLDPGRDVMAVAAADGSLRLWDPASTARPSSRGAVLLRASKSPLYTTAFSPDGRMLAAAGAGRQVWLWNVSNPRHPIRIDTPLTGPTSTIYSVAFSPDGRILAAGSADHTVRLWRLAAPGSSPSPATQSPATQLTATRPTATLRGPKDAVESVAFSPDGTTLAAGSADKTVRLWNVADLAHPHSLGKPLTGPASLVSSVAFSPDGKLLAAGSDDDKVWLWNVARPGHAGRHGKPLTGATNWVNAVSFSPGGAAIAAGTSDGSAMVWSLASRRLTAVLPHPLPVTSVAWSPTGRQLITGDADGMVRTWLLPAPILATGSPVSDIAYSPVGAQLAVAGADLQLWDPQNRQPLATAAVPASQPAGTFVNDVAFAPRGQLLAAGYSDGTLQLWRPGTPLLPVSRPLRTAAKPTDMTEAAAFSPNGKILVSGSDDGTIRLWNVADPARPRQLAIAADAGISAVYSVTFSPNGTVLAVASGDDLTRLWNVTNPSDPTRLGQPLAGPTSYAFSAAFSPNGKVLAVGSGDKTLWLWDVANPGRPTRLATLTGPSSYVYSVDFSPDGTTLAAGVTDGTVWMWNVTRPARPALLATLTGPAGHVYSVGFSPSGGTLAAGSADGTVRLWDTSTAAAAATACTTSGQPLTRKEWASYIPGLPFRAPCA